MNSFGDNARKSVRVAIVTGAGSAEGIGFACAARLAEQGIGLGKLLDLHHHPDHRSGPVAHGPRRRGGRDDRRTSPIQRQPTLVEATLDRFSRVDTLVNNAGMTSAGDPQTTGALRDLSDADWQSSISRNLDTAFFMTRAALGPMLDAGYGRIVNIASVSGPVLAYQGDLPGRRRSRQAGMVGLTRATASRRHGTASP